jgi:signal transduction histidine kinase
VIVIEEILSYLINAPAPLLAGGLTGLTTGVVAVVVLVRTVRQYVGWLEGLNGFLSEMGRHTRLEPALAAATKAAVQLNDAAVALVYLQDTSESALVLKSAWPQDFDSYVPAYVDEPAWSRPPVHRAHTFCPCSLALLGIVEAPPRKDAAIVIAPISAGPRVQGYLVLAWDEPRVPTTAPQTCISVGEHLGVLVDNFWMYEALRAQAVASDTTVADLRRRATARVGLVRGVLHDLRNPLQLVRGFLATSIRAPGVPEDVTRDLRIAQGAAARAIDLAETLLLADVPERYQPQIEPVDVASVIKSVVAQAVPAAEAAKVTLQANIPPDLPAAQADHQALYRILDNLVLNAMRHTAGGGKVTIQPDCQDGKVVVQVSDTGRGMSDDALQTLLHGPLEDAPPGGRLGVWIVRHLVKGMGGELEGKSRPGEGLSLRFTLPAVIRIEDEISCQEVLDE